MNSDTLAPARNPRAAKAQSNPKLIQSRCTVDPCGMTAIQDAFGSIGKALGAACCTDEAHEWSGDSDRLLRIASDIAKREAERVHGDYEAENYGFDIAALILAARRVPGDAESSKRTGLLEAAAVNLVVVTKDAECLMAGGANAPCSSQKVSNSMPQGSTINIDQLHDATQYAMTFGHMLYDFVCDFPVAAESAGPEGDTQRLFALIVALQAQLKIINVAQGGRA